LTTSGRREFLQQVSATVIGVAAAQAAAALGACAHAGAVPAPGVPIRTVVDVSKLASDGMTVVAPIPGPDGAPILVTRIQGQFLALSLHCTHEGCPVNPAPVNGVLRCPCHGSQFDLQGNVLHGPAADPLGQYETSYNPSHHRLTVNFIPSK
jgi:Rieske Fe-S protein